MKKVLGTIAVAGVMAMSLTGCQNLVQNEPVTCTVVDKDRSTEVVDGTSKSVFRVYTEGCGADNQTLGIGDNPIAGNWNSSDLYGQIKVGASYEFKTVGVRNGMLSMFREITEMKLVSETPIEK